MNLNSYVEAVQSQLSAAVTGGDETRALASQLSAALEPAIRLALLDALASAVSEITCELAPGSVELRLRGRDPEFVVIQPPTDSPDQADTELPHASIAPETDEGAMARINLRLPPRLKLKIEAAATAAGLSVNGWLVRAASLAAEEARGEAREERVSQDGQHYRGWAR